MLIRQSLLRMRRVAAAAAALAVLGGLSAARVSAQPPPTTVLELFTSEGCSSCPVADQLFAQYATQPDILALTFNVDYWDYLGWKDTLATPDNTERQREYATARGDGQVYTPQVVVDGHTHVIGSDRKQLDKAIAANAGALSVPITMSAGDESITVTVADSPRADLPHGTVWLVMYNPSVKVAVEKGENAGHTLTYSNVVKKLRPLAMWKGSSLSVDVPLSEMMKAKVVRGAVILQADDGKGLPGPVLGAAMLDLGPYNAVPAP